MDGPRLVAKIFYKKIIALIGFSGWSTQALGFNQTDTIVSASAV
jgi:hypothetical protein